MMSNSSLMSFESLVDYLGRHGFMDKLDMVLQIRQSSAGIGLAPTSKDLSGEYYERFTNTWWEVCWPFPQKVNQLPCCRYLADSLPDALRLRPNISIPSRSDEKPKAFARYLASEEDWLEDDSLSRSQETVESGLS